MSPAETYKGGLVRLEALVLGPNEVLTTALPQTTREQKGKLTLFHKKKTRWFFRRPKNVSDAAVHEFCVQTPSVA